MNEHYEFYLYVQSYIEKNPQCGAYISDFVAEGIEKARKQGEIEALKKEIKGGSMTTKEFLPAFPATDEVQDYYGMDLRNYFAAKAMVAIILHPQGHAGHWDMAAKDAYEMADAMIKARGEA